MQISATLILFFLNFLILTASSSDLKFKSINAEQGLSHENVNDIVQDKNGYIWIATSDGLNRYDGKSLKVYRNQHTIPGTLSFNWIWDLLALPNGDLLVGTRKGLDLYRANQDKFISISIDTSKPALNINQLEIDSKGNIWIATWGDGVYVLDSNYKFIQNFSTSSSPALSSDNVGCIAIDQTTKCVWFGTWDGLDYLDPANHKITHYSAENQDISGNKIITLLTDPNGGIWYGTSTNGYGYLNVSTNEKKKFTTLPEDANVITALTKDANSLVWVGTYAHGLFVFTEDGELRGHFKSDLSDPYSLVNNTIQSLFVDDQGSVWIGNKGLSVYQELFNQFSHLRSSQQNGLLNNMVWTFEEDSKEYIYIATENGLSIYDPKSGTIENYLPKNQGLDFSIIYSMKYDPSGKIWLGTEQGILCYFDVTSRTFIKLDPILTDPDKPLQEDINALALWNGVLWLGTYQKGLFRYYIESNRLEVFESNQITSKNWASFYLENQDYLWLCSIGDGIYRINQKDSIDRHLEFNPKIQNSISNNIVRCITKTRHGAYWIGTSVGLNYYLPSQDTIYRFYEHNGLPNNYICGILEDERGDIWVSTFNGLAKISMPDFQINNYDYSDGLQGNTFNQGAFIKTQLNELFFGGKNGATHFKSSNIKVDSYAGKTNISSFQVQGEGKNRINKQQRIILEHDQNFFSISFMLSNYLNTARNSFEYQLRGIDNDWISTSATTVNYTNVPPGHYLFSVIGINAAGIKSLKISEIEITIRRPWFLNVWSIGLYLLILCTILLLFYSNLLKRRKLKNDLLAKNLEKKKLLEIDSLRSELLSNISHEIRTPLSLILSPVDLLKKKLPEKQKNRLLNIISWNAHRMLFMVNQILDLSRIDAQKLVLKITHTYLHKVLDPIVSAYQSYALNESKIFTSTLPDNPVLVSVDVDKIEKILINLLSNAFKFSGNEGEIHLSVSFETREDKEVVKISITDNGAGIEEEDKEKIFDRFYTSKTNNQHGIGIGLALTKQLIEMHSGIIELSSEPEKYTRFDVYLPIVAGKEIKAETLASGVINPQFLPAQEFESNEETIESISVPSKDISILIVEDDRGLREILMNLLQDNYHLIQANNGHEALKKLEKERIDLIITDLIMPGMDGMEFIRELKSKPNTINIPIIILSALLNNQGKMDAMQLGVEAFLDKPFNNTELLTQIKNILQLRTRLNEAIRHSHLIQKSKALNLSGDHELFIQQLEGIVQTNLSNHQFSVEFLADEMNISRVQLHRKLKQILGITVTEFIRNYRLQLAAQYILSGKTRMTQIAFEVGFSNPSYFAEQFKKFFGCIPSEYKNKNS